MAIAGRRYYQQLIRGVEYLIRGDFNSLWVLGPGGIGKSMVIDSVLDENKLKEGRDYTIFRGNISDAYLYEFIYNNRDRIIIFRDVAKLIRRLNTIDTFKSLTEERGRRIISNKTYAEHDVPDTFEFTGRIIFEINDIMKKYEADLKALFSRGLFVEIILSYDDIKNIMYERCDTEVKKQITKMLISNFNYLGRSGFNLRTQNICFKIYEACIRDKKDWKREIDMFLKSQMSEPRKLLYECAGFKPVKRMDFVKFLMSRKGYSYSSCQRRIKDYLIMGEIFSNGLKKQSLLKLTPF